MGNREILNGTKNNFIESIKSSYLSKEENRKINDDVYYYAVWQGYLDAKRTFDGVSRIGKRKEDAFRALAEKIKGYFEDTSFKDDQDYFDQKHKKMCESLITSFGDYSITYGQAQKIVNMAFKYLYCCKGAEEKKDHFKYCHMALDTYTLNWYKRKTGDNPEEWSKLDDEKYVKIKDYIRDHLDYPDLTVLENEFIIWPDEMLLETIKDFNKIKGKKIAQHTNLIISDEILELEQNIKEIKKWYE